MKLAGKNVTIFGIGRSGLSATKLLIREDANVSIVSSGDPSSWNVQGLDIISTYEDNSSEAIELFSKSDLIIISPGISIQHPSLEEAVKNNVMIIGEVELASYFCNTKILAITGTNGKTTTVSLLGEMIKSCGKKVFIGGNIGVPFCEAIISNEKYDYILLELSSFQLETIDKFHPYISAVLNISQNHGERYKTIESYTLAKMNITKNMDSHDTIILPEALESLCLSRDVNKIKLNFSDNSWKEDMLQKIDTRKLKIIGEHNLKNIYVCNLFLKQLNLTPNLDKSLYLFKGVEHRLESVLWTDKVKIFNDAKSTNWDATTSAIKSISEFKEIKVLILGGKLRGHGDSISPILSLIESSIDHVFLIGESGESILKEVSGNPKFSYTENISNAVRKFKDNYEEGILLLSPAFPSFDQFKSYEDRGRFFKEAVNDSL